MAEIIKIEAKKQALKSLTKVAAYARVSVDKARTLHSLSAQVSYYNKLIQNNPEWKYAGVYSDEGITGTNTKKREGFKRMVRDALAGRIDLIVTKSVSRFARNTVDMLNDHPKAESRRLRVLFRERKHMDL